MLVAILIAVIALLTLGLVFTCYFLWKFAKIIMVFEDDISDTIRTLNEVENTVKNVLEMEIFYDSPEVRLEVDKILDEVKFCRVEVARLIDRFTARSKQQYYFVEEEEQQHFLQEPQNMIPRLPGQPPDTPNPLEVLQKEGMILDAGRKRHE